MVLSHSFDDITYLPIDKTKYTKRVGIFLFDDSWYHSDNRKYGKYDESWYKRFIPVYEYLLDDGKQKLGIGYVYLRSIDWDNNQIWCLSFQWNILEKEYEIMFGDNAKYYFSSAEQAKLVIDKFLDRLGKLIVFI